MSISRALDFFYWRLCNTGPGKFATDIEGNDLSVIESPTQYATLERIVLAEVQGKNLAIHAYDAMVWKIRSGFLTLFFLAGGPSF